MIGLNFFENGNTSEWLIQIVKGLETSQDTINSCKNLAETIGASSVELQDSPGLITYRPIVAMINEGAIMLMNGLSSVEEMDEAVRIRRRWIQGPFEIADNIGVDRVVKILDHDGRVAVSGICSILSYFSKSIVVYMNVLCPDHIVRISCKHPDTGSIN